MDGDLAHASVRKSDLITLKCFHCGSELTFKDRIGFREECESCRRDVHVCKNCHFYDPKVYNECREPSAEVVREKDRFNRCEYFQPGQGAGSGQPAAADLLAAAEALFRKKT